MGQGDALGETELLARVRVACAGGREARLGIVGGTFDPIHLGHVAMGRAARDELALDAVLFMPAGVPSFKRDARLASTRDRVEMARLATRGLDRCTVSLREVARPGVTYTADTLRGLARELPASVRLFFVMGADSLATLPLWREADAIAHLCTVVVARRAGRDLAQAQGALERAGLGFAVRVLGCELPAMSSTEVRAAAARGEDVAPLVGAPVAAYIARAGLYRTPDAPGRETIPVREG